MTKADAILLAVLCFAAAVCIEHLPAAVDYEVNHQREIAQAHGFYDYQKFTQQNKEGN